MFDKKLSTIVLLAREGKTVKEIAKHYNKSIPTINRYIALLRSKGYIIPIKQGRPHLKID